MKSYLSALALISTVLAQGAEAGPEIVLEWYGHAFVRLTSPQGVRVAMDPFEQIGYPMPKLEAEIVTLSHEHGDHNNARIVRGKPVVLRGLTNGGASWQPIDFRHKDVAITAIPAYHDDQEGRLRGKNTVFVVDLGGLRVAHFSDIGHVPTDAQFGTLGRVDVALIPVGGRFWINGRQARQIVDRLGPRVAIPIHYKTPATATWPMDDEREFVKGHPRVKRVAGSRLVLDPGTLPSLTEIWVLEPPTRR